MFFTGCNNPYSQNTLKYYCPSNPNANGYSIFDVYIPSDDCSHWNNFFVKLFNSSMYSHCLETHKVQKQMLEKGLCEKIIVETHKADGNICNVEVAPQHKKVISTMCKGRNASRAVSKMQTYYRQQYR